MSSFFNDFEIFITGDGSPTLKSLRSPTEETMHHKAGAFSETVFIYGRAIEKAFREIQEPHFLSVGLGLGYNEMLIAFEYLKGSFKYSPQIESFETVDILKQGFKNWLQQKDEVPEIYLQIEDYFHKKQNLPVRKQLAEWLEAGNFKLREGLDATTRSAISFHCVLYDAFSSKTSPELWSEEFLSHFIQNFTAEKCVWSTYACTGNLKRALANNRFYILSQQGFVGKRQSTFAIKE